MPRAWSMIKDILLLFHSGPLWYIQSITDVPIHVHTHRKSKEQAKDVQKLHLS